MSRVFAEARRNAPCVLFLSELEVLFSASDKAAAALPSLLRQLGSLTGKNAVFVVGAANVVFSIEEL